MNIIMDRWWNMEGKYKINDVVYLLNHNKIVCGKIYAIKIEIINIWKKQLHNYHGKKTEIESYYSYKVVCGKTRCNDEMEDYFNESELFLSESECIDNIVRVF